MSETLTLILILTYGLSTGLSIYRTFGLGTFGPVAYTVFYQQGCFIIACRPWFRDSPEKGRWRGRGGGCSDTLFPSSIFPPIFNIQGRAILVHHQPLWQGKKIRIQRGVWTPLTPLRTLLMWSMHIRSIGPWVYREFPHFLVLSHLNDNKWLINECALFVGIKKLYFGY